MSRWRPIARAALPAAVACLVAGCGVGAGEQPQGVHLRVTDQFGARVVTEPAPPKQSGSDTVMRLLQRNAAVTTKYSGGFVQSINGLAGATDAGRQVDWFYYANGLLAERGAAAWRVRDGERVWWDRHRWDLARVTAVVGDYPEPMAHGSGGQWAGAQLHCEAAPATCDAVTRRLRQAGVTVTRGAADDGAGRTRFLVGPWRRIVGAASELETLREGPADSGVFATIGDRGVPIVLDERGRPVATAAASTGAATAGLIAGLRIGERAPLWVVTGADDAAVAASVPALDSATLAGRAAVVVRDGRAFALPWQSGDRGREVRP